MSLSRSSSSGGSEVENCSSSPESSPDCSREQIDAKDVLKMANLRVLPSNPQIKELQTIIWDK